MFAQKAMSGWSRLHIPGKELVEARLQCHHAVQINTRLARGFVPAKADDRTPDGAEVRRHLRVLEACRRAFDEAARKAAGIELRKGPRGGGRDLDAIVAHVLDADRAYLTGLGGSFRPDPDASVDEQMAGMRAAFTEAVRLRARGEPPPKPRPRAKMWPIAYGIRRSAWHAIDHVFEIEDRSE